MRSRIIDIVKVNEKTLIFNGLEEGTMLVLQPLVNVLEGTFVEVLDDAPPGLERRSGAHRESEGVSTEKAEDKSGDKPQPGSRIQ